MAKKSVRNIVDRFNQSVSRRKASREAQNERRKLQRRLANILSESIGERVSWKEATSVYEGSKVESATAQEIYSDIEKLRFRKESEKEIRVGYETNIEDIKEKIVNRFPNAQTQRRKNEMFKQEINQATKKEGLSSLDSNETHAFYAATYEVWKNVSVEEDRNKSIMEAFGVKDLETIYNLITKKELKAEDFGFDNKEAFERWLNEIREKVDIDALRQIMQEEMEGSKDEPDSKYPKMRIQNIKVRASSVRYYA